MIRFAPILALALVLLHDRASAQGEVDAGAAVVINLTRTTTATYSVYAWNRLTRPGEAPFEEWAAEFHDGHSHRVETPRDRIVADCAAGTGTYLNLVTGEEVRGPQVAKAACGVQANAAILAAREEPGGSGRFGAFRRIRVRDPQSIRTYDVAPNGAIVGGTIADSNGKPLLVSQAVAMHDRVPPNIFSEESLEFSSVPDEFRTPSADLPE